jgi:hypothetical protein
MADVALADGSTIHATAGHPFWDATIHAFVNAGDLTVGDQVLTADGALLSVTGVYLHQQDLTAYNLTITDIHTYYAGETPVLTHNCPVPPAGSSGLDSVLATSHGQQQLATRGFDSIDIALARSSKLVYGQADRATAHVAQLGELYNVVVIGDNGLVTAIKGLAQNELRNLARNYGWSGFP